MLAKLINIRFILLQPGHYAAISVVQLGKKFSFKNLYTVKELKKLESDPMILSTLFYPILSKSMHFYRVCVLNGKKVKL